MMVFHETADHLPVPPGILHGIEYRLKGSLSYGKVLVYELFRVDLLGESDAGTDRTCTEWGIEGKHPGLQLLQSRSVIRAGQLGGKVPVLVVVIKVGHHVYQTALRLGEGQFAGFCDTAFLAGLNLDPVNHDLYGVLVGLFQLDLILADHLDLAVHQYPGETFPFDPVDDLLVGALLGSHHRRKDLDLGILVHGHDSISHLIHGL